VNTYDPSDYIHYVHVNRKFGPAATNDLTRHRLPGGYANASPRTRLRSRAAVRAGSNVFAATLPTTVAAAG
jgi:hypothetical protein